MHDLQRATVIVSALGVAAWAWAWAIKGNAQRSASGKPGPADSLANAPRARAALSLPGHHWLFRRTANADIYVLAGSRAEARVNTLADAAERAITADLRWIGKPSLGIRLRLFFVGTRAEMRPLTGTTYGGIPFIDEGSVFFQTTDTLPPALRHELMHVISWRAWGPPATEWLSEGVATLVAGGCGGYTIDEIAATLDHEKKLIPLETLWQHFDVAGETGAMYYMEAASLFAFVDRTFGRAKLEAFWPIGAYVHIKDRLGVGLPTLERRWRADLATHRSTVPWSTIWEATRTRGCEDVSR